MSPARPLLMLAGCAALAACPAMAQDAPFALQSNAEGCSVASAPGNASGVAVEVALGLDGTTQLRASSAEWSFEPGRIYRIRIHPAGVRSPADGPGAEARGFRDPAGWSGISARGDLGALTSEPVLALYRGSDAMPFAQIPNPYPHYAAELRRCRNAIVDSDHGSGRLGVAAPVLRGGFENYVTDDDYPSAAIRAEQSGTARIRLAVSAHGLAARCEVTASSGSELLDRTSCALFQRRGRFLPARDAAGAETEGTWTIALHWELSGERQVHVYATP